MVTSTSGTRSGRAVVLRSRDEGAPGCHDIPSSERLAGRAVHLRGNRCRQEDGFVSTKGSMAGWIGFAGIVLLIAGTIDFFQGLIALFQDDYYVVTKAGFLAVDLTAWGWVMLIWGTLLVLSGLGLMARQGWARWFAIFVVALNFFAQLGFLGNSQYTLWALTALALNLIVLYALTVRWSESAAETV
jgi:hypothetical protein